MNQEPGNEASIRIAISDVYREVVGLRGQVSALTAVAVTVQDHEARLRKTERVMYMALGIAAASPFIAALVY